MQNINNEVLSLIVNAVVLLGTSQLSFFIGAVFVKERIYSKIDSVVSKIKVKSILCLKRSYHKLLE